MSGEFEAQLSKRDPSPHRRKRTFKGVSLLKSWMPLEPSVTRVAIRPGQGEVVAQLLPQQAGGVSRAVKVGPRRAVGDPENVRLWFSIGS
jgi:hypothetical protein